MYTNNTQRGFSTILIAIIALVVLGVGVAYFASTKQSQTAPVAETNTSGMEGTQSDMAKDAAMMGPSVMLKNGKLMLEDKGKSSVLTVDYVFPDGTKVSLKGLVTKKDGTTATLKEGESVWPGGSIIKAGEAGSESMGASTGAVVSKRSGVYGPYDQKLLGNAAMGKVVLFFHATWCPICHALDQDIRAHLSQIPEGTYILVVDYDTSGALKQKYGITEQHTLVQVDKNGNLLKKWIDSTTLADVLGQIK